MQPHFCRGGAKFARKDSNLGGAAAYITVHIVK